MYAHSQQGQAVDPSPADRRGREILVSAQGNVNRLQEMAKALGELASRVVGPRPSPGGEKRDQAPVAGNFEAVLSAITTDTSSLLEECGRSLRLLEEFI